VADAAGETGPTRPWTAIGPSDAPGIVFIHGTRLTRSQWSPQLRRLAGRYRCVAVDLPGHGDRASERFSLAAASDAVVAAIDAEVPSGRAVLVGLSLGGYVAIETADRAPDHVAGLVLAGCSAEPVGPVAFAFRTLVWTLEHVPPAMLDAVNRAFFRVRYGDAIAAPIIAGGFWSSGGAQAVRTLLRSRFLDRLARLWTPVLVVNGALDPVFGPGGDPWAAACRRGRHVVIARAMHLASLDRPRAFSDIVAAFTDDPAGVA
jgi:pimeloyl-ACP methyl ester carboxylesterase